MNTEIINVCNYAPEVATYFWKTGYGLMKVERIMLVTESDEKNIIRTAIQYILVDAAGVRETWWGGYDVTPDSVEGIYTLAGNCIDLYSYEGIREMDCLTDEELVEMLQQARDAFGIGFDESLLAYWESEQMM